MQIIFFTFKVIYIKTTFCLNTKFQLSFNDIIIRDSDILRDSVILIRHKSDMTYDRNKDPE